MSEELDRFLVLFDRLVHFTHDGVANTPKEMLGWHPPVDADVRFGERVTDVTIKNLFIHLTVGEHNWVRALRDCEDGAVIKTPRDPALTESIAAGDFLETAARMHTENMQVVRGYTDDTLRKSMEFSERSWSVMGFLWAIYGHRNYHLGNIDMYWRLGAGEAPDYFNFTPRQMV